MFSCIYCPSHQIGDFVGIKALLPLIVHFIEIIIWRISDICRYSLSFFFSLVFCLFNVYMPAIIAVYAYVMIYHHCIIWHNLSHRSNICHIESTIVNNIDDYRDNNDGLIGAVNQSSSYIIMTTRIKTKRIKLNITILHI